MAYGLVEANPHFSYQYSTKLERTSFDGRLADYLYLFITCGAALWVAGYLLNLIVLGPAMLLVVIYVWSQRNPEQQASFWGIKFKAQYLPWALCAFTVLLGGSPIIQLCGIAAGHMYYFLEDIYPNTNGGVRYLSTPSLLYVADQGGLVLF